ncbi:DUF362 domain-containing protein [Singulisphaera acidiphila]|uniref:DUF362 domain-containing protein n=1 Tax=Singulisphaera acidiphila (strain ATCC BAA-1392 / DSM 18658 / VKM B-2454 / MOB10) TaxID=886293 RepID=L0D9L2_SINAD|nr:DUF362 domain-containing protein [Singulisphaera acidiphila]AGA25518.1 hypothetical protein Sinac_1122 [Singulisphaera acidiphila DSM 18658]
MRKPYPCGGLGRRQFLASAAALPTLIGLNVSAAEPEAVKDPDVVLGKLGLPGPYPGRVIEARNPAMIKEGVKNRDAIKATLARGMKELTGADDDVEAWRSFFEPGDVVGIKMNPVGNPLANTSSELMLEVIEGLKAAGVKTRDMFVFERYKQEFMAAGMHKDVPDGVRWGGLTPEDDPSQLQLSWPGDDPIAGYDPDEYMTMQLVHRGSDPKDDRTLRSHLGLLVTKRVNKLVLLPVLKDHGSAGVTGALKNMSHGLVNNVARSHSTPDTNACNQFIPQVVSHPILRKKCVLQILDGIKGVFQKGPFGRDAQFVWEYNALLLATDPVALDHVEWRIIDARRKEEKLPPVAGTGKAALDPLGTEGFDIRQPQHIALAGNLGLGRFDFNSPQGRRRSIDHRIIDVS